MGDMASCEAAVEALNGQEIDGRSLTVSKARPRTDRPAGDRGGNRW